MKFSEVPESGITMEQEVVLHRIYERIKGFSRDELIEATLWAWQQCLALKNDYLELACNAGLNLQVVESELIILPADDLPTEVEPPSISPSSEVERGDESGCSEAGK